MLITLCVIAYNEEESLSHLLHDIAAQTYPRKRLEIILVDSSSADGTKAVMRAFKEENEGKYHSILLLNNPGKTLPKGWNIVLENYSGAAVLRIDAHTRIPGDFIRKNVETLKAGHDICGGKVNNIITNKTQWGKVLYSLENSMFGGSFAAFRRANNKGHVNTLAFGLYRREVFAKTGRYNENLARTEDNDMHYRMRKAGFRFYYNPEINSYRETRNTCKKLLKQKYMNGYWIGLTMGVRPQCFSVYHFVPFLFVLFIVLTLFLLFTNLWRPVVAIWVLYFVLNIGHSVSLAVKNKLRPLHAFFLPVGFFLTHFAYGLGTFVGLLYMPFWLVKTRNK